MKQLKRAFFVAVVLLGGSYCQVAHADVEFIDPTIDLAPPTINFDTNINPVPGTLSSDALNIIRAHRVALQQVQAAIRYLEVHRADILAGDNAWYNENFGDFYDPNSPFAGLYNRILKHDTGNLDKFGNPIYEDWYNTAHYDRVMYVFRQIQTALQNTITYAWGAQTGNAANSAIFDNYRLGTTPVGQPIPNNGILTVGDPLFGSPQTPDYSTPLPIDPSTGLPYIDPITMLPIVNPPLVGDPLVSHFAIVLPVADDRGSVQWGDSTSYTAKHLAQIANNPNNPLSWDDDNDINTGSADQDLAFFRDRLDAYAVNTPATLLTPEDNTVFVGGAFLTESQRSDSSVDGQPNPFFHPTEFNQFQQIIMALGQSVGSLADSNGNQVSIENGISEFMGPSAYFFEALDGRSYASFTDLFQPVQEGGIGDGSLLPPPGKQGGRSSNFVPLVPAS